MFCFGHFPIHFPQEKHSPDVALSPSLSDGISRFAGHTKLHALQFGIQFSLFRLITENGNTGIRENTAPIGHKKRQKNLGSNAIPAVTNKKRPVPIRLSAIFN